MDGHGHGAEPSRATSGKNKGTGTGTGEARYMKMHSGTTGTYQYRERGRTVLIWSLRFSWATATPRRFISLAFRRGKVLEEGRTEEETTL